MKMVLGLEELKAMRADYQGKVVAHLGPKAEDMAMSAECMHDLLERIHTNRKALARNDTSLHEPWRDHEDEANDATLPHLKVADLGGGFSTLALLELAIRTTDVAMIIHSVDHNRAWQREFVWPLVRERLEREDESHTRYLNDDHAVAVVSRTSAYVFSQRSYSVSFYAFEQLKAVTFRHQVIIVDHGPDLPTRARDTAEWLPAHLDPNGFFAFDDWRPKHEGRIRRALGSRKGGDWVIESGGDHLKRFSGDKTIGYAWRRRR